MLREAEQINVYNWVKELLLERQFRAALDHIEQFHIQYPELGTEVPQSFIATVDIINIDEAELEALPWIYVAMLRSLTLGSSASDHLERLLAASPAAAWRLPLPAGVPPMYAFEHIYDEWFLTNRNFVEWCNTWFYGIDYVEIEDDETDDDSQLPPLETIDEIEPL